MRTWLARAGAFLVAWTVVDFALAAVDWMISWKLEPYGIAWICLGIGLRLQSERLSDWPVSATPADALRFLWQCAKWPWHPRD